MQEWKGALQEYFKLVTYLLLLFPTTSLKLDINGYDFPGFI